MREETPNALNERERDIHPETGRDTHIYIYMSIYSYALRYK